MEDLRARPTPVTAAAVLLFVQAVLLGIVGVIAVLVAAVIGLMATGAKTWDIEGAALLTILVIYSIGSPTAGLMIAMGLWGMRTWAWKAALLFEGFQLLVLLYGLVRVLSSSNRIEHNWVSLPVELLPVVVVALLLTKGARQGFRPATNRVTTGSN
jgi:hypothetical protein